MRILLLAYELATGEEIGRVVADIWPTDEPDEALVLLTQQLSFGFDDVHVLREGEDE